MACRFDPPFDATLYDSSEVGGQPTAPPELTRINPLDWDLRPEKDGTLPWPPGKSGKLAQFVFGFAQRPVKEIALVAAIGQLAGVCGRAYNVSHTGLNVYAVAVARSATGKEVLNEATSALVDALDAAGLKAAAQFFVFKRFASGPALANYVVQNPCFVQITGEWGRTLKAMSGSDRSPDHPLQTLRTQMTDLYHKSGRRSRAQGAVYADPKNGQPGAGAVAYSLMGETTPGTYYEAVTANMMEDGFLSRFLCIEYRGERPPENQDRQLLVPQSLVDLFDALVKTASECERHNTVVDVVYTPRAAELREEFNKRCDAEINRNPEDEGLRQCWNRADLKAQRVAALFAVADNHVSPTIYAAHYSWARLAVERDIAIYKSRLDAGQVGNGDFERQKILLKFCTEFLLGATKGYHIPDAMVSQGIVPRKYLQVRAAVAAFKQAPQGAIRALNEAIQSLCDSGYLLEVDKIKAADDYGYQGRCYRITNLLNGLLE